MLRPTAATHSFSGHCPMMPAAAVPMAPPARRRMPPAARSPIDSDPPDNQPLEPGRDRRICRPIRPRTSPPRKPLSAARRRPRRRAANPVSSPPPAAPLRQQGSNRMLACHARKRSRPTSSTSTSLRAKMMKRVKSLFIAASIIAIVVGGADRRQLFRSRHFAEEGGRKRRLRILRSRGAARRAAILTWTARLPPCSRCRNCGREDSPLCSPAVHRRTATVLVQDAKLGGEIDARRISLRRCLDRVTTSRDPKVQTRS